VSHHQVDGATRGSTDKAAKGVFTYLERQACVVVVVERAEALVSRNRESKSLRDPLYGEVAELLKFLSIHNSCLYYQEFEN
jgi:hypothetical protein